MAKELTLEDRVKEIETHIEKSWLTNRSFLKRTAAVFGYAVLGYVALVAAACAVLFFIGVLVGIAGV